LEKGIPDANEAIRLDPNKDYIYDTRGNAYFLGKDYDKAIADFETALRLNPNNAEHKQNFEKARKEREVNGPIAAKEKDFYGTWKMINSDGNTQTITITNKKFSLKDNYGYYWNMEISSWEVMSNPPGYRLIESLFELRIYQMYPPVRLYLSDKGKSLRVTFYDEDLPNSLIFLKQ
jgi:tetratricopeptide (TPR) repeat protein